MGSFIPKRCLSVLPVCFLLSICCAWAQTGTTSLHGTVLDSTRLLVARAMVTLDNQAQGFSRNAIGSSSGEFEPDAAARTSFPTRPQLRTRSTRPCRVRSGCVILYVATDTSALT